MDHYDGWRQLSALLCALLFAIFGLCYLMGFQSEYLQMAQHVWSDGQTEYMTGFGPVLIVGLLTFLGMAISSSVRLWPILTATAYAPSFILLALLTTASLPVPDGQSNGWGILGFCLWTLGSGCALWVMSRLAPRRNYNRDAPTARIIMGNLLVMALLMFLTVRAANTRIRFHYALRMTALATEGEFDDVLKVGGSTPECSRSICAMRAYALASEGLLPEKLFSFPQHHGALGLIPPKADSAYVFDWPKELYRSLGSYCVEDVSTPSEAIYYLRETLRRHPGRIQADYLLCAYLLERRLDDFAGELIQHYELDDSLPRHYKEALVVYQRRNATPLVSFHDEQTEANYLGFQCLKARYARQDEQEYQLTDMYPETYWCYYYFPSRKDK